MYITRIKQLCQFRVLVGNLFLWIYATYFAFICCVFYHKTKVLGLLNGARDRVRLAFLHFLFVRSPSGQRRWLLLLKIPLPQRQPTTEYQDLHIYGYKKMKYVIGTKCLFPNCILRNSPLRGLFGIIWIATYNNITLCSHMLVPRAVGALMSFWKTLLAAYPKFRNAQKHFWAPCVKSNKQRPSDALFWIEIAPGWCTR